MDVKIPTVRANRKLSGLFSRKKYPIIVVNNIGKNNSFKCSHTLSFTALNDATNKLLFDNSNAKCNKTPNIAQNMNEKILKLLIENLLIVKTSFIFIIYSLLNFKINCYIF